MTSSRFLTRRNSRTNLYGRGARPLDPDRWITLQIDPAYADTYAGQVALLTGANLLGRMTPSLALDLPSEVRLRVPLPWAGRRLDDVVFEQLFAATPAEHGGRFEFRSPRPQDYVLSFGPAALAGAPVVHGYGWNAYFGAGASPIAPAGSSNPLGPAFSAILAGAHLMVGGFYLPPADYLCNALDWSARLAPAAAPQPDPQAHLGDLWTIGTGSVGTAILYFLTLFTRHFDSALIDKDHVKIENLDRSPIFVATDDGRLKAIATAHYLRAVGVGDVRSESCALGDSELWKNRQEGTPDLVIAAANEDHVRYQVEVAMPPVQVYGTTGKNWQASVIRHIPNRDPCSLCLFPDDGPSPTACATGTVTRATGGKQVDAALPFLSFSAGLMAAAEILKLDLPGFPFAKASTQFAPRSDEKLLSTPLQAKRDCLCQVGRNPLLHARMISGTRHAALSAATGFPSPAPSAASVCRPGASATASQSL